MVYALLALCGSQNKASYFLQKSVFPSALFPLVLFNPLAESEVSNFLSGHLGEITSRLPFYSFS